MSTTDPIEAPVGEQRPRGIDIEFTNSSVINLFKYKSGQDLTKDFDSLGLDSTMQDSQRTCLRNLFLSGMVDNRNSPQC